MAWIEKREGKKGRSYRICVSDGVDAKGRQIIRRMTWSPEPGMTARQEKKALDRAVADFERSVEQGFRLDQNQTLAEYGAYVIELKERAGVRPRTIDRYLDLTVRINAALGHLKLTEIRPQHLNAFYANLGEEGVREDGEKAATKDDLTARLKETHMSQAELARKSGVSASTISAALRGKTIQRSKAEAIAAALDKPVSELFEMQKDTTPLSSKTILEYHRLISTILAQAEKEMLVPYNAAAKATPPKVERKTPDYYQPEEMDRILDVLEDAPLKWKAITYLLIDTGCRRGEAAGLKWESVDLDDGIITIERALLYSSKRGVYEGPPKTGKVRSLKLAPETLALLKEHREEQESIRKVLGDRWVDSGYVFTQENGDHMNPDSITDWLNKFSRDRGLPHIHPHAFRHTAASTMIANGVDLVTTAGELGHASSVTTSTIYAHQIATAKARAGEVRSGVFSRRKRAQD